MGERIYLSSPDITQAEEDALLRALRSGWVAPLGPEVDAFEDELAAFNDRAHAVALSSGTAALHLALLTAGVGPGDHVLTSTLTFAATTNAIVYTGAEPVFVDADESGNISPRLLEQAAATLSAQGRPATAIVPVDLLGKVVDHEAIEQVAAAHGATVISDAAESLGARRSGRPAGAFGDAAIVSFNGNKVITTSGGGALLTDDAAVADTARYLATQARQPVIHYEHTDVGYNYRLSNLLAAVGRAQLQRLPAMLERRRHLRDRYREVFSGVPGVELFGEPARVEETGTEDNYWLSSILVDPDAAGFRAEDLHETLSAQDIETRPLWKPMHLQPVFAGKEAFLDGTSERIFRLGLSLPSGSVLTDAQEGRVLDAIADFLSRRSRA